MDGDDLRRALAGGATVLMPGIWDALSARLTADAGFAVAFCSGYCVSATLLGLPDYGYVTGVEMAEVARRAKRAAPELGVVVDGDTGYGNALNAIRTVEAYEGAGAAGIFIEDQVWPKRCGHMAGKQVIDVDDWLAKLRAAVDHRDRLHVTARTDARAALSLDEAIERGRAARDAGVDAVFVEAPQSTSELEAIGSALAGDVTLVANMVEGGATPLLTPAELHERGFDLIVSPLSLLFSATAALRRTLGTLAAEGTLRHDLDDLVGFEEFGGIVRLDEHRARDERYRS